MLKSKIAAWLVSIHLVFLILISFYGLKGLDLVSIIRINLITILFLVFGIIGLVQFLVSGYKKSQLLRLFVFYQCFKAVAICLNYYLMQIMEGMYRRDMIFFLMLSQFIEILILFPALGLLQTSRKPCITTFNGDGEGLNIFESVNRSKRLLHLVIDVLFVSYVAYTFLRSIEKTFIVNVYDRIILTSGLMAVFFGIYYLVMELFFKVTFAKIITNTIVVNKRGKKAGIFHTIARSLCRFIPLEGISFLFKDRGWHDMLSGTYVVNDQYSWEKRADAFDTYFTGEPESEPTTTLIP